ncbi:MAG: HAD-IA family hydrolase [Acidobacteriota bacterium]|jgi:beta-phosphoglucomutase-like phosphatase (HAD superfamily)|nr:HAD-IA family hydrolase [Acidobacteriota bacterium]NLT34168.1 HAD-IA family hydrolase [Acidobacteriota bacterium]
MRDIEVPEWVRGLIFDCDGTLVDSMPLHMRSWEQAVASLGGAWDPEFFTSKKGMPERHIVGLYNERYGTDWDPETTVRIKHGFFHAHADLFQPIPHVVRIAREYCGRLPMAVASGGIREIVTLELEAIQVADCFPVVLTADDGFRPKPAPDLFLEAARRLGVPPESCQVFEDGDLGLEAARAAGMLATDVR